MTMEGSGIKLGDLPAVQANLNKVDADHDLLKAFHSYLFGAIGKKASRKKDIRAFSGFPEEDGDDAREARAKKFTDSKKWTNPNLKDLCIFLGLEKGGDKGEVVDRIVTFLYSPNKEASKKAGVAKRKASSKTPDVKSKKVKKDSEKSEKSEKKEKRAKKEKKPRPLSGFIHFSNLHRARIIKSEPDLKFTEVGAKLGAMWKEQTDAQKEKYKSQAIDIFNKSQQNAAAPPAEDEDEDDAEDDRQGDEDDEGEEED